MLLAALVMAPWSPWRSREPQAVVPAIPMELVTLSDHTVVPREQSPSPEVSPARQEPETNSAESPPAPSEPAPVSPPPPAPVPPPPPAVPEPVRPAPPEPAPSPEPAPEPVKEPEAKPAQPSPPPEKPAEKKKKKEDDLFLDDVIKDLTPRKKKKASSKKDDAIMDDLEKTLTTEKDKKQGKSKASGSKAPRMEGIAGDKLSLSEMDAVRAQVAACWNLPAGGRNAEDLRVEVRVEMNPDGTVRDVKVLSTGRMGDPLYRAAAESAVRALMNPRCTPLKLPPDKYSTWQRFTILFDPAEMFR